MDTAVVVPIIILVALVFLFLGMWTLYKLIVFFFGQ